ncbi:MAG: hypothetical protein WCS28_09380 [Thiomicrospira sp.]|jgi:REP element-mobilizing transposase RayT
MGRSRYKIAEVNLPHFVTCTVVNWLPVFTRSETVNLLLDSLRFLQAEGLKVYAWVVLENHLHLIVQADDLPQMMKRFKRHTAKHCLGYLQQVGAKTLLKQFEALKMPHKSECHFQFWQEGYHPEWIQNEAMMRQKMEYIHYNPVKRGYVDLPEHWRYSSARNFAGQAGLLDVQSY